MIRYPTLQELYLQQRQKSTNIPLHLKTESHYGSISTSSASNHRPEKSPPESNKESNIHQQNDILPSKSNSLILKLRYQEQGLYNILYSEKDLFSSSIEKNLKAYHGIYDTIKKLQDAINTMSVSDIQSIVEAHLIHDLLEVHNNGRNESNDTKKIQEKMIFINFGGLQLIMQYLLHVCRGDARNISKRQMRTYKDLFNLLMFVMKDFVYNFPGLTETFFQNTEMILFITMLSHSSLWDHSLSLLVEIVSYSSETFCLSNVPKLHEMIILFSSRQLSCFCTLLTLLLFEPEDRNIMEGSHQLRSIELLQLRRNRMSKLSNHVEKNQNMILEMPLLLERLLQLLHIMMYGPDLELNLKYKISTQASIPSSVLHKIIELNQTNEWEYFKALERNIERSIVPLDENEEEMIALCELVSQGTDVGSTSNSIQRWCMLLHTILLANGSDGSNDSNELSQNLPSLFHTLSALTPTDSPFTNTIMDIFHSSKKTSCYNFSLQAIQARTILRLYAMSLLPYQIEILFVFSTLLSGRRKLQAQTILRQYDLNTILLRLFRKLSWDSPMNTTSEHIHGPHCECNSENAIRIQVLRIIYNYIDRDFILNRNKADILSSLEKQWIHGNDNIVLDVLVHKDRLVSQEYCQYGLISLLLIVLKKQPHDSIYRFWLSSSIEAFLRGTCLDILDVPTSSHHLLKHRTEQEFVAQFDIIKDTIMHIVYVYDNNKTSTVNLQTAFDFLGEVIKYNPTTLNTFLECFQDSGIITSTSASNDTSNTKTFNIFYFQKFMNIAKSNLIESNVFIRSLFVTKELMSKYCDVICNGDTSTGKRLIDYNLEIAKSGYLSNTWIPFAPRVISIKAIEYFTSKAFKNSRDKLVLSNTSSTCNTSNSSSSSSSALNTFSSGIQDAIQGISGIANQFVESISRSSSNQTLVIKINHTKPEEVEDNSSHIPLIPIEDRTRLQSPTNQYLDSNDLDIDVGLHYTSSRSILEDLDDSFDFETPPEQPRYSRKSSSISQSMEFTSSSPRIKSSIQPNLIRNDKSISNHQISSMLSLSHNFHEMLMYFSKEQDNLLLRLMTTITLRTINHENICCLNTSLLILIFSHQK